MKTYPSTPAQRQRLATVETVSDRHEFPAFAREHSGHRVAIRFIRHRGSARRTTVIHYAYGVLIAADKPGCYTIEHNGETHSIHYGRITDMHAVDYPANRQTATTSSATTEDKD